MALEFLPDGTLLDGFHRRRAALELNVPYPRTVRSGLTTEAERTAHVLALHAHRRHLSPAARRELMARLRSDGLSLRAIAQATGTPRSTVARALAGGVPSGTAGDVETVKGLDGKTYPRRQRKRPNGPAGITVGSAHEQSRASTALLTIGTSVSGRQLSLHRAERLARESRLVTDVAATTTLALPPTLDLRLGDFREVLNDVPDGSVDLVLTDPPWTMAAIREGVFADVAALAARILRPGRGHLAIYTGTQHLPRVLAQLEGVTDLEYRWTIAVTNGAGTAGARLPRVSSRWKPVALYRRTGGGPSPWLPTDLVGGTGAHDKELHRWQQGVSEAEELITMLTDGPGALVVDTCAGSASFGVAAFQTGRRWIGAELNPNTFAVARARLAQLDG